MNNLAAGAWIPGFIKKGDAKAPYADVTFEEMLTNWCHSCGR